MRFLCFYAIKLSTQNVVPKPQRGNMVILKESHQQALECLIELVTAWDRGVDKVLMQVFSLLQIHADTNEGHVQISASDWLIYERVFQPNEKYDRKVSDPTQRVSIHLYHESFPSQPYLWFSWDFDQEAQRFEIYELGYNSAHTATLDEFKRKFLKYIKQFNEVNPDLMIYMVTKLGDDTIKLYQTELPSNL